jgi:DNA-binding IclR family transcriptional regulator
MTSDVGALRRGAALLKVLAEAPEPVSASEAARRAGIPRNTALRTLNTLADLGWVTVADAQRRFRLSPEPARLFGRPWEHASLTVAAHPPLRRLAAAVGETVYVAVRDGERSVNVQVVEGRGLLRIAGALGQGFPLHASAPGKIFLAFEPGILERQSRRRLEAVSDATITDAEQLRKEIRRVRQQGYAINREELARGLVGLALPVLDASSHCVAALGVLVPVSVCKVNALVERFHKALSTAATAMSRALGRRE